jgi:hypothetical protein
MLSILSHEYTDTVDSVPDRENRSKTLKSRLGDQLDEMAVFAFVAVAVMYIAAATYGLIW